MITFERIRWMNLLSTGNTFTEISLNTHNQTLIVGENGAGKSTILDALFFGLYGKPFRKINKNQLLNSINNKNLIVEIEFNNGAKSFLVRRGIKPNIFEVYADGTLVDLNAASSDYQEMLDKQILRINSKPASQIVVLGSASFVPFMQLAAAARREVIEDLLDIQIFTTMNVLLKERVALNKNALVEIDNTIGSVKDRIKMGEQHIDQMQTNTDELIAVKRTQLLQYLEDIEAAKKRITEQEASIEMLKSSIADDDKLQTRLLRVTHLMMQLNTRASKLQQEIEFFATNHDCPTCSQGIENNHKEQIVSAAQKALDEIENGHQQLVEESERLKARQGEIKNVREEMQRIEQEISIDKVQISLAIQFMHSVKKEIDAMCMHTQTDINKDAVKELQQTLEQLENARKDNVTDRAVLDVASVLLKDTGIKTKIIRQYIPIINKLINKYLASMDFFVNFELNENFEETIKSRFRDEFSYASFSEGEKSRIDLALMFTWRAIAKLRNSANTNLLILDEVFDGSLDASGNEELLKILQTLTKGHNVFVISHKTDAYLDKFERVIKAEKQKNFSKMVVL